MRKQDISKTIKSAGEVLCYFVGVFLFIPILILATAVFWDVFISCTMYLISHKP